ncbi:MAG: hypothetical protein HC896_05480 [Bacteroidales bacterium]|nr:hypothetical protein [Bacteroidales bacterium]
MIAPLEGAFYGIYLDDKAMYTNVRNNVVIGSVLNYFLHGNQHIRTVNNVFVGNDYTLSGIHSRTGGGVGLPSLDNDFLATR